MFSTCLRGFSPGAPVCSHHHRNVQYVGVNTPVSASDQGPAEGSGVGLQALYSSSPLLLLCVVQVNYEYDGSNPDDQFPQVTFLLLSPSFQRYFVFFSY